MSQAGPFTIDVASLSSNVVLSATCVPAQADPAYCRLNATDCKIVEAGSRGIVTIVRADKFNNLIPAGENLMPFRIEATGVGPAEVETVEAGDGSAEVRFEARAVGRYTLYVWSGFKREPILGSPVEIQVVPSQPAAATCKALLEGCEFKAQGVYSAQAGTSVIVRMQPRDRFGNSTAWKSWQTLRVSASGAEDVEFTELKEGAQSRGVFRATLHKAGAYVVWVTVGGQTISGWPRVVQIIPGTTNANVSSLRPESDSMALATELIRSGGNDMSLIDALGRQSTDVDKLRGEMIALRNKLAQYERNAHEARQMGASQGDERRDAQPITMEEMDAKNDKVVKLMVQSDSESAMTAPVDDEEFLDDSETEDER
jgi:hypothetical protein